MRRLKRRFTVKAVLGTIRYAISIVEFKKLDPAELEERKAAMMAIVGLWKDRTDLPDTETYVRSLRSGTRLQRLHEQWRRDEPESGDVER
jgi:hypothetical protein